MLDRDYAENRRAMDVSRIPRFFGMRSVVIVVLSNACVLNWNRRAVRS